MPHVYILGIKLNLPESTPTPWGDWSAINALIAADVAHAERNGFTITVQKLEGTDIEGSLQLFERQLTEEKDRLDGIMFGMGIRTHGDPIPFERALGVAGRVLGGRFGGQSKGGVRLMLNDGPDRHCWALERGFGVKMAVE